MTDVEATKTKKKPQSRRFVLALVSLTLIILLALLLRYYNQTPAEGVIVNPKANESAVVKTSTKRGHYSGNTIVFDYPGDYAELTNNKPNGLIVEQLSMVSKSGPQDTRRISFTVKRKDAGVIMQEDAAYKLRLTTTKDYTHEQITAGDKIFEKFTKTGGMEVTYFTNGSGYYASISGTNTNIQTTLSQDLDLVVGSFNWLK